MFVVLVMRSTMRVPSMGTVIKVEDQTGREGRCR